MVTPSDGFMGDGIRHATVGAETYNAVLSILRHIGMISSWNNERGDPAYNGRTINAGKLLMQIGPTNDEFTLSFTPAHELSGVANIPDMQTKQPHPYWDPEDHRTHHNQTFIRRKRQMTTKNKAIKKNKKQYVIVRAAGAGVHSGFLESKTNDEVVLSSTRRLWRWWSRFTLSELALDGPLPGKENECKFSTEIPLNTISGWCEILPCSDAATKKIREISDAK